LLAGLGSAAVWPVAAQAQQAGMPVIGFLATQSADNFFEIAKLEFLQGLRKTAMSKASRGA
jgi:hypothetical protein